MLLSVVCIYGLTWLFFMSPTATLRSSPFSARQLFLCDTVYTQRQGYLQYMKQQKLTSVVYGSFILLFCVCVCVCVCVCL